MYEPLNIKCGYYKTSKPELHCMLQ